MADIQSITRRMFLRNTAAAGAVGATISTPVVVEAAHRQFEHDLTAVPSEVVDKIKAWQTAHRSAVKATEAYSASLRVKPIDKPECDRCFYAMSDANAAVGPAREAMIFALWSV